ncbi:MAG TPA: carboxypeptidase-like regulatory domain-containing protein, partial [Vicinamibacterales bacterium]
MYRCIKTATLLVALLLLPAVATAQVAQASITGVVRDSSGAVLPGVTVEAASPVLIEKVRSVVTDGSGQYRIVDLLPGTYAVTFTLTGFSTVRREGVELIGSLTATINIDLRVGALEETITVTGESPIVDVQSARRQQVIDGNVLQEIPTSRSYNNVLQIVPGIVAGDGQVQLRPTMLLFTAAGGNAQDGRLTVDGINTGASRGGSGVSGYVPDMQNVSEVLFTMSGNLGEAETGGPQMQIVPRSGGNRFTGSFFATGVNEAMQDSNFTPELLRVLTAPAKVLHLYDFQASVGGPIKKDNLWFFFNWREVGSGDAQPGIFANRNAGDPTKWTYDPDLSRQARIDQTRKIMALRLTWQATPRNKFTVFYDNQPNCTNSGWTDQDDACHSAIDGWVQGGSQVNGFFGPGPNAPETGDYSLNP